MNFLRNFRKEKKLKKRGLSQTEMSFISETWILYFF